mmetsp:Transcript_8669/g.12541  ORF Transcript_8669/g.12541 Transcript_8669/m.12541 type:complete len:168 (+) Transcript_8669:32-535(+)
MVVKKMVPRNGTFFGARHLFFQCGCQISGHGRKNTQTTTMPRLRKGFARRHKNGTGDNKKVATRKKVALHKHNEGAEGTEMLPLTRRNRDIMLDAAAAPALSSSPYKFNKNGKRRSDAAIRQAKSRNAKKIVTALEKIPESERAVAMRDALVNPKIVNYTQSIIMQQ